MRWQTTAVLAVLLLLAAGGYYWYEVRLGPEREKAEGRKGRIFSADPADVSEAVIKRAGDTVRLKREGDGWRVLEPLAARGDRGPIEETMTTIVTAKMDREIADQPASLADFGLDKPVAEITLTLKSGSQLALDLGGKNPTGVWVYARERDKPSVFVLGESVLRDATRPATDFRDKTILTFDRKDVAAIEVVLPDDTLALELAENRWRLTRPRPLPADDQVVGDLLEKLQAAKVKEFVAESPRSLEPFGLDRPVRIAIHTGKDKDRAVRALLLGKSDDQKKGVFAMRPGESSVLLLPEDVGKAVPRNVAAVRDKSVVALDRDRVTTIEVESPRGAVTLSREQDTWKMTRPEGLGVDQVEAGALLTRVANLRALAFVAEDAAGVARYLARPEVKVVFGVKGASAPTTLLLAPSPDRRDGKPTAYAAVAGGTQVVLVDGSALTDFGKSANELRDHTLVGNLEVKDVQRMHIKRDGKTVLMERRGESEWRMLEPSKGAVKAGKADDVLFTIRALKWREMVAPKGEDAAKYGLATPSGEVALFRGDGTEIATLLLGGQDGGRRYVKLKSAPAIYAIDARLLELPKVPEDFQG
jgi:hypothetical protein